MEKTYLITRNEITTSDILNADGKVIQKGVKKTKFNIQYFHDGKEFGNLEFFGYEEGVAADGVFIKEGYTKREDSL